MVSGSIARRYAKALFALAAEKGRVEPWSEAMETLGKVLAAAPDVAEAVADPVRTREERRALVQALAAALKLETEPSSLLFLLADRNRLDRTPDVVRAFRELADAHLGRVRAQLTSAVPLAPGELEALAERLSSTARAKVLLEQRVEPALLGGVVAQVGSLVYDGSVRTQLEDLRKSLKG